MQQWASGAIEALKWRCDKWNDAKATLYSPPLVLVVGGCSMSSACGHLARDILKDMGIVVGIEEHGFVGLHGHQVNDTDFKWEVLKAKKNPCCWPGQPTSLNALDKIVCKIRDCFRKGVSKFENGTEASLCFDRRKEPAATKAVVPLKTLGAMLLTFTTYNPDRFPLGSQEDVLAKMFDGSKHTLHSPTKLVDYLVERGSMAKEVVFTEELLQYEVDGSARGLQKSVAAWTKVLNAWRLHPERNMLLKLLTPGWGKRKPPPPHREVIYNHEEVREALFTNPQWIHLRWMWRD
eukprot:gene3415-31685_t